MSTLNINYLIKNKKIIKKMPLLANCNCILQYIKLYWALHIANFARVYVQLFFSFLFSFHLELKHTFKKKFLVLKYPLIKHIRNYYLWQNLNANTFKRTRNRIWFQVFKFNFSIFINILKIIKGRISGFVVHFFGEEILLGFGNFRSY